MQYNILEYSFLKKKRPTCKPKADAKEHC
jgi:hypothetical protein